MKRNVRKILSLVLVVVMLCGVMVPGAMAATTGYGGISWTPSACEMFGTHKVAYQSEGGGLGFLYSCYCGATGYSFGPVGTNHTQHSLTYSADGTTGYHYVYCTVAGCPYAEREQHTAYCPCNDSLSGSYNHTHVLTYTQLPGNTNYHYVQCTVLGCTYAGYDAHTGTGVCTACGYITGTGSGSGYIGNLQWTNTCTGSSHIPVYYRTTNGYDEYYCSRTGCYAAGYALSTGTGTGTGNLFWYNSSICSGAGNLYGSHSPYYSYTYGGYDYYSCYYCNDTGYALSTGTSGTTGIQWYPATCDYSLSHSHAPGQPYIYNGVTYYTCTNAGCTATGYSSGTGTGTGTGSDYAYGSNGKIYVAAYDSMTNDTYTINESVTLQAYAGSVDSSTYTYTYSWSGDVYAYDNSGTAYLDTSGSTATAYCIVTAADAGGNTVDTAYVTWYATAQAGDGIIYSAVKGNNVVLDAEDFEEFWEEQYPNGTLSYVRFTGVSTGNLYDNYAGGNTLRTDVRARGTSCYLSPTATQVGLDDLTYVPATYGSATTVTIQFTAYGSSNYNYGSIWGSGYGTTSLSGTVTILYTAKEVTPIAYSITGTSVALEADDFASKYKEVMDVAYAGNLSIQFLEAPSFGTLTLGYGTSYWQQTTGTKLTDTNIGSYSFSTSSVGTYSIDNLTYTSGTTGVGDTIRFACYSGSQLKFIGTVTFGASAKYTVEFATTAGKTVKFSATAFNQADTTGLLTSGYIYFGTPTAGTLYKNYSNGTGTRVTTNDYFTASDLSTVTYVPRTGHVGVAEIPYTAYTYMGQQFSGTVKVYVGRSFTDVQGTPSAWAIPYINKLSAQGIVNGTDSGMTKFSPTKTVTYGEALKLIMMASGYPEQAKTSTHWASGYLTKAYYDGLVSSSTAIDLNAEVTRDTIASITAKALKLNYATSVNYGVVAPTDSTNGYVYALYNAGIVNGTYNAAGQNVFNGGSAITRAEISKIVCMISDYAKAN